jgi:beta-fructofuranosidase
MVFNRRRFLGALGMGASCAMVARRRLAFSLGLAEGDAKTAADLARDTDRPEYHFIAPRNWMNDPNGPIWWKGEYHLFYQWAPYSLTGGAAHWGHAASKDLVHWRHFPIALTPTAGGWDKDGCWTGSAVVQDGVPTVIYTGVQDLGAGDNSTRWVQRQMLATAEDDRLLRWKKISEPVLAGPPEGFKATGFRDPCPWQEDDGWYLIVGSGERDKGGCVLLYRSQDLLKWEYLHPLVHGERTANMAPDSVDRGDMWECPDFFEVDGQHCLLYSSENKVTWATGEYDRRKHLFTIERTGLIDQGGVAYYAPKSFRSHDGRRILWGWVREMRPAAEFGAAGWAGAISLPRVLTIGKQGQLEMQPAAELESLRGEPERARLDPAAPFRRKLTTLRQELRIPVDLLSHPTVTVRLFSRGAKAWELALDVPNNSIRSGETTFPFPGLPWPEPTLRLFLDGSILESYVGGREALTSRVYGLKPDETEIEITFAGKGHTTLDLWPVNAISSDRLTT